MELDEAIEAVEAGHAERICAPGQWVVWRDGNSVNVECKP